MSQQINTDIQYRVAAEDLACLGYQPEGKLVLGELGGFAIVNESGQNKRTVLFNDTIRTAWTQLLAELTSRFPDLQIPDILQSPRFFPVSADKQHGIFLRPDGLDNAAWLYKFSGNESITLTKSETQGDYFVITINNIGQKQVDANAECLAVMLGYESVAVNSITWGNGNNRFAVYGNRVFLRDLSITTVEQMKAKITGQYLIYQLAEPIFIPFEQPLDSHLTLHDASDYDVWLPLAEDGTEMYEYLPDFEGCKVYHWNRTWVKAVGHQPCPLETFLHGWTERLNAAFFRNFRNEFSALKADFEEYKRTHP